MKPFLTYDFIAHPYEANFIKDFFGDVADPGCRKGAVELYSDESGFGANVRGLKVTCGRGVQEAPF